MPHRNETRLRELYAIFATGDMPGFFAGCTDDSSFTVPGNALVSGVYTKTSFLAMLGNAMGRLGGTFEEHVLDVFANDEHGVLMLVHKFTRDGQPREYRTSHIVEFRDGQISKWTEHPGSLREFDDAWGAA